MKFGGVVQWWGALWFQGPGYTLRVHRACLGKLLLEFFKPGSKSIAKTQAELLICLEIEFLFNP